jgi:uncharacterized protein YndB with AHSA1/START domain
MSRSPISSDTGLYRRWKGSTARLDQRPGGLYRVVMLSGDLVPGEYVEVKSPTRIVFTWASNGVPSWRLSAASRERVGARCIPAGPAGVEGLTTGRQNDLGGLRSQFEIGPRPRRGPVRTAEEHQASTTGSDFKPRRAKFSFHETRSVARRKFGQRRRIVPIASVASRRASGEPRQKWPP